MRAAGLALALAVAACAPPVDDVAPSDTPAVVDDTEPPVDTVVPTTCAPLDPYPLAGLDPTRWFPGRPFTRADGRVVVPAITPTPEATDGVVLLLAVGEPGGGWSHVVLADRTQLHEPRLVREGVIEQDGRLSVFVTTGSPSGTGPFGAAEVREHLDGFLPPIPVDVDPELTTARTPVLVRSADGTLALLHDRLVSGSLPRLVVSRREPGTERWDVERVELEDPVGVPLGGRFVGERLHVVATHTWAPELVSAVHTDTGWSQRARLRDAEVAPENAQAASTSRLGTPGLLVAWGRFVTDGYGTAATFAQTAFVTTTGEFEVDEPPGAWRMPHVSLATAPDGRGVLAWTQLAGTADQVGRAFWAPVQDGLLTAQDDAPTELRARWATQAFLGPCGAPHLLALLGPAGSEVQPPNSDATWTILAPPP